MKRSPGPILVLVVVAVVAAVLAGGYLWQQGNPAREEGPAASSAKARPTASAKGANVAAGADTSRRPSLSAEELARDPASLRTRVAEILKGSKQPARDEALRDLAIVLARHHPTGASAALQELLARGGENSGEVHHFVSHFSSELAQIDPAATAAWLATLPESLKFAAATSLAPLWARTDLAGATAWAETLSDLSLRATALRRIGQELAVAGDPTANAGWAQRLARTPEAVQHAELIGRLWAAGDIQGAFQWAVALEDSATRHTAVVAVASVVAERDPQVASGWVAGFPEGELRNQAASAVSLKWSESNPEAAARWLSSFGNQQLLELGLQAFGRRWLQSDAARAAEWIRNAPISRQVRDYLLPGG